MRDAEDYLEGPLADVDDQLNMSATLVNSVESGGEDRYGDQTVDETAHDVRIEVATRGTPQFRRRASGMDLNADALVWIHKRYSVDISPDEHRVPLYDGSESDDDRPSVFEADDGHTYEVFDYFDEYNGRWRCHCMMG